MITKIKNNASEDCFAIVLNKYDDFKDVVDIQKAIITLLRIATNSDTFDAQAYATEIYALLDLLLDTLPNEDQITAYERIVFAKA